MTAPPSAPGDLDAIPRGEHDDEDDQGKYPAHDEPENSNTSVIMVDMMRQARDICCSLGAVHHKMSED
jgi:hypothetical protein